MNSGKLEAYKALSSLEEHLLDYLNVEVHTSFGAMKVLSVYLDDDSKSLIIDVEGGDE